MDNKLIKNPPLRTWPKPSHLIVSHHCRFGKTTAIGDRYVVSSVGEYFPGYDWNPGPFDVAPPEPGMVTVGCGRYYETMVFNWDGKTCEDSACNCGGQPIVSDYREIDMLGANSRDECLANHNTLVNKWRTR